MHAYSQPGNNVYYTIKCGVETAALRIVSVDSAVPCGPRSNLDFTHFVWSTFAYYCTNCAMVVLPSQTSGDKIIYTRHYKAEIGTNHRPCKKCVCKIMDLHMFYNFGCQKPNRCTCILCCKNPLSL
jgi:hypothetical protein